MPWSDIIRKAIELGRDKGFVTFNELNELWLSTVTGPEDVTMIEPEDVETVLTALSDEGINVIEDEGP
jgi:hypothetical protein